MVRDFVSVCVCVFAWMCVCVCDKKEREDETEIILLEIWKQLFAVFSDGETEYFKMHVF